MTKVLIRAFTFLFLIFFCQPAVANCDFKHADYLELLKIPSSIKEITVTVINSKKFKKNFAKILASNTINIPKNLKKKFKAIVRVSYDFGDCEYKASVRQNGDWKDHIQLSKNGEPIRSIKVKLKEGNVLNAIKFKLLIPETRNGLNEIIGTIILREIGFIAPETSQISVDLDGVKTIMLFQEDAAKELLERNQRREGVMFEGDEASYFDNGMSGLQMLLLSRVTNPKWFLKGESSQKITLLAFEKLQKSYMHVPRSELPSRYSIFPNRVSSTTFQNFSFIMFAMNATHGLALHNRRFYYNGFESAFEPIYYDGNISLDRGLQVYDKNAFENKYNFPFFKEISEPQFIRNISNKFVERVFKHQQKSKIFLKQSIYQLRRNMEILQKKLNNRSQIDPDTFKFLIDRESYIERSKDFAQTKGFTQNTLKQIIKLDGKYLIKTEKNQQLSVNLNELSKILSENKFLGNRTVYLPDDIISKYTGASLNINSMRFRGGKLTYANGMTLQINQDNKEIVAIQSDPKDWLLISDADLDNWTVTLDGKNPAKLSSSTEQRFNDRGLTGCLNFYKVRFHNTKIATNSGGCEDAVNVFNSKGNLRSVEVLDALSDGIDFDFSNLRVNSIISENAGNDCLDVSSGNYIIVTAKLANCSDKGVSVGESSKLSLENLFLNGSSIAVSSKDYSNLSINKAIIENSAVCSETLQKKQEFGGAITEINALLCMGSISHDKNSVVRLSFE